MQYQKYLIFEYLIKFSYKIINKYIVIRFLDININIILIQIRYYIK